MSDEQPSANPQPAAQAAPNAAPPSPDTLKAALKAFKKRLKLTQLDQESRIGRSPMSSGQRSTIVGIVPPDQYPLAVWETLVDQGKLKRAGRGFYTLA